MIENRPCVNGIVAAVLSASVIPIHGALAREKSNASNRQPTKPALVKVAPAHQAETAKKPQGVSAALAQ